jgi:long-chain acyl-CoA synthetase
MSSFQNLGQLICRNRDLAKIAIIDLSAKGQAREISYAALDAMANGVARALERRKFERGDRIAILSVNCAEYLCAYFGIMRAGLVAVPVNYRFPPKMIDVVIRDAGAKLVFCDSERRAYCPSEVTTVCFDDAAVGGSNQFLDPGNFTEIIPTANEPAMFLYTSGSSGVPKGVVLSHQSHIWVVETSDRA